MINYILSSSFVITDNIYFIVSAILVLMVILGLILMSKVEYANLGNTITGLSVLLGVIVSLLKYELLSFWAISVLLGLGIIIGVIIANRVKMIDMPQLIALLNSFGGLASAIVGGYSLLLIGGDGSVFSIITSVFALVVGLITFTGSIVAALKLHRLISQRKIIFKLHSLWTLLIGLIIVTLVILQFILDYNMAINLIIISILSLYLGFSFTLPVGGADMPIVISLLNSLSGVAGALSGLAIGDILLVSIGGIVGASGLLLTQIMSKAMNRNLLQILYAKEDKTHSYNIQTEKQEKKDEPSKEIDYLKILKEAKNIIIVPGYGMAVAQAQHLVKELSDLLIKQSKNVRFAIHPVAGRMPGHMNVLLAEARINYDLLKEMDELNDEFRNTDLTIVIGANDVVNPAARTAKGTPLYQMPILNVDKSKNIFIFNYDLKPGYSGVDNPLYDNVNNVKLFLGNAFDTLQQLIYEL